MQRESCGWGLDGNTGSRDEQQHSINVYQWQYDPKSHRVVPKPNYRAIKHQFMTNPNRANEEEQAPVNVDRDAFGEIAEIDRVEREGGKEADRAASQDIVEETDQHQFCKPYNCHQSDYPDMPDMDPPESLDAPDIEVTGAEDVGMQLEEMSEGFDND